MHEKIGFSSIPLVASLLLFGSGIAHGQGISSITVQSIGVNPAEFLPSKALTITIDVKAPPGGSGKVRAYVNAFKGDASGHLTWLAADWLGGVSQEEASLNPNEVRSIRFSNTLTIPGGPGSQMPVIYLVAGAFDPPAEFAQEKIVAYDFKCPGGPTVLCRYIKRTLRIVKFVGSK